MALSTQDFTTLVRSMVASVQGGASTLINLGTGSALLAALEAVAGVVLWLQGLILQVLTLTRAATSSGADLDSWVADFGVTRLAATAATGTVTFSRFTPSAQAVVPVGTSVQTADGTQTFTVALDTTNAAYNSVLGGYVLNIGVSSVTVSVAATVAGSGGNVLANTITSITTPIAGVDTVTNGSAFTNGLDAETDTALRTRFVSYIASLSKATKTSIGNAIASVQQGLAYTLTENQDYNGATDYGYFYVVVDDGTGYPSTAILNAVGGAIEAVRAAGVRYSVFAPAVVTATPAMTVTAAAGYVHATIAGLVATALQAAINALPIGTSLPYTQLAAIAYSVAGVANVTSITLNGGTADLTASAQQVIKCSATPVVN